MHLDVSYSYSDVGMHACLILHTAAHACTQQHILLQSTLQSRASKAMLYMKLHNFSDTLWLSPCALQNQHKDIVLHPYEFLKSASSRNALCIVSPWPVWRLAQRGGTACIRGTQHTLDTNPVRLVSVWNLLPNKLGFREVRVHTSWCSACLMVCWPARFGNQAFMTGKMTVSSCRECSVWTRWKVLNWAEKALMEAGKAGVMPLAEASRRAMPSRIPCYVRKQVHRVFYLWFNTSI